MAYKKGSQNRCWYTNGKEEKYCNQCPEGWKKGRCAFNNKGNNRLRKIITFGSELEFKNMYEAYLYLNREYFLNISSWQNFKYKWNKKKDILTSRGKYIPDESKTNLIKMA